MSKASAVVFEKDGNRFIAPNFWWPKGDEPCGWLVDAMLYSMRLRINYEDKLLTVPMDSDGALRVPCVRTTVSGPQLLHGRGTVYMISGPLFDECKIESSSSQDQDNVA